MHAERFDGFSPEAFVAEVRKRKGDRAVAPAVLRVRRPRSGNFSERTSMQTGRFSLQYRFMVRAETFYDIGTRASGQIERYLNRWGLPPDSSTFDHGPSGIRPRGAGAIAGRSAVVINTCNTARRFGDVMGSYEWGSRSKCRRTHMLRPASPVDRLQIIEVAQTQLHGVIASIKPGGRR